MATQTSTMNLQQKLLEIQKQHMSFTNSEDSAKKEPSSNKSTYQYTPGHVIIQSIRRLMDQYGLSLIMEVADEKHELVTYPVYKLINGTPKSFDKTEMYVTIKALFTWKDRVTGETEGPITYYSSGANGMDKSMASALALAQRYFLLKYFNIATKDTEDEPDAHDSSFLPGLPADLQPQNSTAYQNCNIQPQQDAPQPPQNYQPQQRLPHIQQFVPTAPPAYATAAQQNPGANDINTFAARLAHFENGTENHRRVLNEILKEMDSRIFPTGDPSFINTLVNTAQSIRTSNPQRN